MVFKRFCLTVLAKTFFLKAKPAFSNGQKTLSSNPFDWTKWGSWVFDNFIVDD